MSSLARRLNANLDLTSKLAVLVGGSQGIGAGVAVRFAQAGCSVIIVGRNEERMSQVIERCKQVAKGGPDGKTFDFIKGDLSRPQEVRQSIKSITEKSKGSVNYLVQTQGGPPNGKWIDHHGIEYHFAIQVLSRFAIADRLSESGVLKEASINVCAPGMAPSTTTFDVDDLEGRKGRNKNRLSQIMAQGNADSTITDAYTRGLQAKYPNISFFHLFPGAVTTNSAANQGFPFPLPQLYSLASPIISRTIGNSAESYSEIPVFLAANSCADKTSLIEKEGRFLGQRMNKVRTSPWSSDPANQKAICEKLRGYGI